MNIAKYIDHTFLKAYATRKDIEKLCGEASEYGFASVCVNSCWVPLSAALLKGTGVKVCTVVGFPLGAMSTASKAYETARAVEDGADEIDMVINIGLLKGGDNKAVLDDIRAVREASEGKTLKVIIEACLLTEEEKVTACLLSVEAGADFVKTSTGFSTGGATAEDVALMKRTVGGKALVKAAGGIRTAEDARRMVDAGASRIGASAGIDIVKDWDAN